MPLSAAARKRGLTYGTAAIVGAGAGLYLSGMGPLSLNTGKYLPHGVCYTWQPSLVGLHLVSDVLIGLAYTSIPVTLVYFIRRRTDLPFNWMFVLFGLFIVACGATHWMEVLTMWYPHYWIAGTVKAITAAASVPTAILLVMLVPRALAIPSTAQLREARDALEREVAERKRAEEALRAAHATLEQRVAERTAELASANLELQRQREQLREADTSKDRFLAVLSHELRNPIHAIGTAVAYLTHAGPRDSVLQHSRDVIGRQVANLGRLLEDLLDVSRITAGGMEIAAVDTDARDIVAASLDTALKTMPARHHEIEWDRPASPLPLHADPVRLEQILVNLLENAAKYTDPGGKIVVSARAENGRVVISVRDNGIGIEVEELEHVFGMFARGRNAKARVSSGLGIGLHLAREIARLHRGELVARSEGPGHGSEFVLTLPLGATPAHADTRDAAKPVE